MGLISNTDVSSEINKETQNSKILTNPFTKALNLIATITNKEYFKPGTATVANIKKKSKNDTIPNLTDYYTIVNYWNGGTSTGTLSSNSSRCHGACTGFCVGTCYGSGGVSKDSSGTQTGYSNPGCGEAGCGKSCSIDCINGARNYTTNGVVVCQNGCGTGCRGDCHDTCAGDCEEGCSSCTGC